MILSVIIFDKISEKPAIKKIIPKKAEELCTSENSHMHCPSVFLPYLIPGYLY
jgi:hypothetical protein